jgi:large subunit ribosomal protein L17
MFRNMVTSLLKYDRIKTTDTRAKEVSRWADHIITLAKRGDLHARRQAMSIVREKDVVHKLFEEANERFGQRNGGYTRIVKIGRRPGDAALVSMIELISADEASKKKKKRTKSAPKKSRPVDKAASPEAEAKVEEQPESTPPAADTEAAAPVEQAAESAPEEAENQEAAVAPEAEAADAPAAAPEADAESTDAEETEKKPE